MSTARTSVPGTSAFESAIDDEAFMVWYHRNKLIEMAHANENQGLPALDY
jgi:hypothetical protein